MPKVSRDTATVEQHCPVEDRHEELDDYAVNFLTFQQTIDASPLFKGLPGDQCSCPHWGYVFAGKITFRFDDHDESFEAGDAFYVPAGHTPIVEAGTEYVQFSPSAELQVVSEAMMKNALAMGMA